MRNLKLGIFYLAFLIGCSDYNLQKFEPPVEPGEVAPEIEVDPIEHDFGAISAGSETSDVTINIENLGNGDLILDNI